MPELQDPVLPETVAPSAETFRIRLEGDLDADGQFGKQSLEVTDAVVRVRDGAGQMTSEHAIADLDSARNEPLVGGGRLELTTKSGHVVPIISYSSTLADRFSEAARGIEQLAKGQDFIIELKEQALYCKKCQRRLPEKDGKCPACVSRWRMLARIAAFLKPYKLRVAALAGCSLLGAAIHLLPPYIQGKLIDGVLLPKEHAGLGILWQWIAIWIGVVALGAGVQICTGRLVAYLSAYVIADIRAAVYQAIELLQMSFFEKKKVGAIQSRLTNDTQNIWGFLVDGVPFLLSNMLMFTGTLTLMALTSWQLTLAILTPIVMVFVVSATMWGRMIGKYIRWSHKWSKFQSHLTEALTGVKVMKAFAQEKQETRRFVEHNDALRHSGASADQYWYTVFGAMTFFTALAMVVHFAVGGAMVYHGKLTLGQFWKVQQYLALVIGPMQWFAAINNWFSRAMAGAERIFEVMDTTPEKYAGTAAAKRITGEVEFAHVRFGYDKSNPVIRDLSFHVKPGEMIGLVGKSGSGKSTTISLLCRFYEPDSGCIKIDGVDYRDLPLQDMRSQIGVVLQEPFLFNGTIAENISYGKPGAGFDEIMVAAKAANAHTFILSKPDGYDTVVGERGSKLSGGERQRISIARAILHNPRILILDEATSSVDVETEKQIQEAIARLIEGRTTFAIAHRLSTLRNASRLIVLDKGQIVEIGTHAELMAKAGVFANLVKTQSAVNEIIGVGNMA